MKDIEQKTSLIKNLLENVSKNIDQLNFETFDTVFPNMVSGMKEVHKLKHELIDKYGLEKLKKYEQELFVKAKLIEKKYDNTVEVFLNEGKRLENELSKTVTQKRIINYIR